MDEIWKPIKGYEGFYEASNTGNIRSVKRKTTNGKILKGVPDKDGYFHVSLSKQNVKKRYSVHRLIAETFIPNNENYPVVNHKNENKQDNSVENLEWCTVKYNTNYNGCSQRRMIHRRKPILAKNKNEVIRFESVNSAAERLGVAHGNISSCLHGRYGHKTIKGYIFEFE